jgi:flagellar hook-associated protein 3 FlgL
MFRVTSNTFPNSLNEQLGRLSLRQTLLNQEAATGQRIKNPEDDPAAVHRVMDLQRDAKALGQYQRNISQLKDQATVSYSAVNSLKSLLTRAQELATRGGGLNSQSDFKILAQEVNQLIKTGVQAVNTKFKGDYLFGGTLSNQPPFVETDDAAGNVTAVTYAGNTSAPQNEIAEGVTTSASVLGANTSGAGPRGLVTDSRSGADLFNHLIALRDALNAGDTTAINTTVNPGLAADEENLLIHIGINGALQSQLDAAKSISDQDQLSLETAVSGEVDVDMAQTLLKLSQTQTAYQAALQSGGRILSQSLLDYL